MAVALIGGGAWRQTNGRMRAPRGVVGAAPRAGDAPQSSASREGNGAVRLPVDTRAAAAVLAPGVLAAPAVLAGGTTPGAPADRKLQLTGDLIGGTLGERATLVQFSSAFCAPCRATRRILTDVAGMTSGVAYVEIDAESRLDLVRRLNILRTPTVLVLDADGGVVRRASGQPRKADVIAAIGVAVGIRP